MGYRIATSVPGVSSVPKRRVRRERHVPCGSRVSQAVARATRCETGARDPGHRAGGRPRPSTRRLYSSRPRPGAFDEPARWCSDHRPGCPVVTRSGKSACGRTVHGPATPTRARPVSRLRESRHDGPVWLAHRAVSLTPCGTSFFSRRSRQQLDAPRPPPRNLRRMRPRYGPRMRMRSSTRWSRRTAAKTLSSG